MIFHHRNTEKLKPKKLRKDKNKSIRLPLKGEAFYLARGMAGVIFLSNFGIVLVPQCVRRIMQKYAKTIRIFVNVTKT